MAWDRTNRPVWLRYTVAVLVAVIAAAIRLQFLGILELRVPFVMFFPAVAVAALYGGLGAGLLATIVSAALADYFWIEPVGQFAITNFADLMSMVVFLASGTLISYLAEATYRTQARAHKAEEQSKLASERMRSEVLLQRQAELLHLSYDAIIVWRLGGRIESWNKGAEELYGYSQEESVDQVTHDLLKTIHSEPWAQIEAELRERKFWEGELKHRTRDGREVIVSARHQLVRGADRVERVLETNRDITEKKQAEEELRDSERYQRLIVQAGELGVNLPGIAEVIEALGELIAREFHVSRCGFSLMNLDAGQITVTNDYHSDLSSIAGVYPIATFAEHWQEDGLAGRTAGIDDLATDPRTATLYKSAFEPIQVRAHLTVPLHRNGKWVSNFWISHHEPRRWTAQEMELIKQIAERVWDITERKRMEVEFRESEERFRVMADSIPQLAWLATADGYIYWYNQRWYDYTGATPEQMEGWGWQSVHDPDALPGVLERWKESIATGKPFDMVFPLRGADGNFRQFLTRIMPVKNANGDVMQWCGTNTDITEHKRMEMEREVTIEILKIVNQSSGIADMVKAAITFFQHESGCEAVGIRLNQGEDFPYFEARGFPEEFVRLENSLCSRDAMGNIIRDSLGDPFIECMCGNVICGRVDPSKPFFSPGGSFWANSTTRLLATSTDADRQTPTRNRCNGEGYESVALIPLNFGTERIGLLQLSDRRTGMFSPEIIASWEKLAGYLAVALSRLQTGVALRESEERFRIMADSIPQLAWIARADGYIYWYNQRWYEYTGTTPEQMEGWGWQSVHDPDALPGVLERWKESIATGKPFDMVFPLRGADGSYREFLTRIMPVKNANGDVMQWCGTNTDITERKQAEASLTADLAALTRMHALSVRLLETGGMQSLLQEIMESAVSIVGAEKGTLQLLEDDSLRIVAAHGHQQPFLDFFASAESQASVCGEATKRGERVVVSDVETSSLFIGTPSLAVLREAGVRAAQSTPMMSRSGTLLGILTTQWGVSYTPDEHDLWRIDLLVRQAADLIEHSKAEEALQSKDAEIQMILNRTPFMLTRCSRDLRYLFVSQAYAKMLGRSPEQITGKPILEIMGPEGFRTTHPYVEAVLQGQTVEYEAQVDFRGVGPRLLRVVYMPDADEQGRVTGWIASTIDVTERKQMQEELSELTQRLSYHVDNSPLAVIEWGPDMRLIRWSGEAERMFGWRADEVIGKRMEDFRWIYKGDEAQVAKVSYELQSGVNPQRFSANRNYHKDGSVIDCEWYNSSLLNDSGKLRSILSLVLDVTERKRMENDLRKSRDELELRVEQRTTELNIYMAKLEQSNQALQDFASIAAHDMKEPLRKVISFGNMLRQKCGDSLEQSGNDYLDRMLHATERMQSLLTGLLDYSRVATTSEPFKEVDLSNLIREVLSDLEVRIVKTGGEVHIEALPVISANPTQMRQLFQNLIGNALKFHKPGGKPMVQVHSVSNTDSGCQIVVEDNGIGFDDQYLEKIFAPFQRLHARSEYEGTGMGLAICKKIVERHGGSITAKSTPGEGSLFVIDLPARQAGLQELGVDSMK